MGSLAVGFDGGALGAGGGLALVAEIFLAFQLGGVGKLQRHRHSVPGETVCSAERRQLGALSAVNEKKEKIMPMRALSTHV